MYGVQDGGKTMVKKSIYKRLASMMLAGCVAFGGVMSVGGSGRQF